MLPTIKRNLNAPPKTSIYRLYQPVALSKRAIWTYLATLTLLAIVLVVLFALSTRNDGIDNYDSQLYYVWTYGPTAVFTVVATIWAQVEFRIMQRESWSGMLHNVVPAKDSVLMDYYAVWNVWAMFKAVHRRHYRVVLAVAGTLLISALTIASTALFVPQFVTQASDSLLHLQAHLEPPGNIVMQQVSSMSFYRNFLLATRNVTTPLGSHHNLVFEPFQNSTIDHQDSAQFVTNASYTAPVKVLASYLDCEEATVIDNPRPDPDAIEVDSLSLTVLESPSCHNTSLSFHVDSALRRGGYSLFSTLGCCGCGPTDADSATITWNFQPDAGLDWRLFTFAGRYHDQVDTAPTANNSDYIAFICKARLQASDGEVTERQGTTESEVISEVRLINDITISTLNSSSPAQLLFAAAKSFDIVSYSLISAQRPYDIFLNPNAETDLGVFFDHDYLKNSITTTIPRIMAQVAHSFYLNDSLLEDRDSLQGTISISVQRLIVRNFAFAATAFLIALLGFVCAMFLLIGIKACFPNDPRSIAAIATILAQSPQIRDLLNEQGVASDERLSTYLQQGHFKTHFEPDLKAHDAEDNHFSMTCSEGGTASKFQPSTEPARWWQPMSSTIPFRTMILSLPLILIAVLEVCLQISIKNDGLATVARNGAVHYLWLFMPAYLILGIRALFGMVDSDTRIVQPFAMLSKGRAAASSSMLCGLQGRFSISALVIALKNKYWAVLATTLAMLFAPAMSIVVASLFSTGHADTTYAISLEQMERWNFSDATGSLYYAPLWYPGIEAQDGSFGVFQFAGQEAITPSMILNANLSFPQWTTNDFVLPALNIDPDDHAESANPDTGITVRSRLPVLRPNLNCHQVEGATASFEDLSIKYSLLGLNLGDSDDNCGYVGWTNVFSEVPIETFYDGFSADAGYSYLNLTDRDDCPTRLFFISEVDPSQNTTTDAPTKTLACRPRIEQVLADITFNYPSFSFSTTEPPRLVSESLTRPIIIQEAFFNTSHADPPSQTIFNNWSRNSTNSSSGMGDIFPTVEEVDNALLGLGNNERYSTFTQIELSFGTSSSEMYSDTSVMDANLNRLYRIIVGQLLKIYGVQPLQSGASSIVARDTDDSTGLSHSATLCNPHERVRIVQNQISTRVLEGLLALTTLCIGSSMFLVHMRRILPKDPGTIAGTMSLLAGASPAFWQLFEREGVEFMTEKEMRVNGMFDGVKLRMGWFGVEDESEGRSGRQSESSKLLRTASPGAGDPNSIQEMREANVIKINDEGDDTTGSGAESKSMLSGHMKRRWCIDVDMSSTG